MFKWAIMFAIFLCGCQSKLSTHDSLLINTRIVIEYKNNECGQITEIAVSDKDLNDYLFNASKAYKPGNIYFNFGQPDYIEFNENISYNDYCTYEASLHPNQLTLYFLFSRSFPILIVGESQFPWDANPHGLVVYNYCLHHPYLLSHELGHSFGLFHTFSAIKNVSLFDDNIMNYSSCEEQFFTPKQLKEMVSIILLYKKDYLLNFKEN